LRSIAADSIDVGCGADPTSSICSADSIATQSRRASFEQENEYRFHQYYETSARQLEQINAAHAYARGAFGEGERLLVVDSGLNASHQEFSSSGTATQEKLFPDSIYAPRAGELMHGTGVLGVAVAERDGAGMFGVAFGASAHLAYFDLESDRRSIHSIAERSLAIAGTMNASVINFSFGDTSPVTDFSETGLSLAASVIAQRETPDPADKRIFVWAAGNEGGESPVLSAGFAFFFDEIDDDHVLAVVAVDPDGGIADYSNRCGIAKNFCLAAPGTVFPRGRVAASKSSIPWP